MRRHDDFLDHDHHVDDQPDDITTEFWGDARQWHDRTPARGVDRTSRDSRDDSTGAIRAIRDGVHAFRPQRLDRRDPSGEVRRTRVHGSPRRPEAPQQPQARPQHREATLGELAAGADQPRRSERSVVADAFWGDDDGGWDDRRPVDHEIPLTPVATLSERLGVGAVDPLLVRLGTLVLVGVMLVPLALGLRPGDTSSETISTEAISTGAGVAAPSAGAAPLATAAQNDPSLQTPAAVAGAAPADAPSAARGDTDVAQAQPESAPVAAPATQADSATADQTSASEGTTSADSASATTGRSDDVGDVVQSESAKEISNSLDDGATASSEAERLAPECPATYTASPGDSWYRIADAAGVTPSALLAENSATVDTVIFAGDEICLPSGAATPAPPTTAAPTTTDAPSTTGAPSTTSAPTTTAAPATTTPTTAPVGSPGRDASVDEVKAVIRSIFPESEWETAYEIVRLESRFRPEAYNGWCCYGVFQIYWDVHRSWLDDLGINSASDLYDPLLNTKAAYAIWQRAGNSWTPWSTYSG